MSQDYFGLTIPFLDVLGVEPEFAKDGQGWVLAALIAYQNGFIKGLREALEFDLI